MEILPNGLVEPASPTPLPFGPKTLADLLIEGFQATQTVSP